MHICLGVRATELNGVIAEYTGVCLLCLDFPDFCMVACVRVVYGIWECKSSLCETEKFVNTICMRTCMYMYVCRHTQTHTHRIIKK